MAPHGGAGSGVDLRHRPCRHRHAGGGGEAARRAGRPAPSGPRPRGVPETGVGVEGAKRRRDHQPAEAARLHARLLPRAVHARRGLRRRRGEGVRRPLREGLHLPRPVHGQLGPRAGLGRLRPGGGGPGGHRHARERRVPAHRRNRRDRRRHGAARDDAWRHRDRRESRRRALSPPARQDRHPAAGGPGAADRRRRARRPGVRHRCAQGHARPTTPTTSTSHAGTGCPRSA